MTQKNQIIITGGNGFLGSHIVKKFTENGIRLTCLVRKDSHLDYLSQQDVDFHYGDITEQESLNLAFQGHDFVIHNAALAKDWGKYQDFYQANIEGTLNVLRACVCNQIKDVILTSTNSVYGEEDSTAIKNEKFPYNSHYKYFLDRIFPCKMNYYRDTKRMASQEAVHFAKENGINLTILEPVWIYGENGAHTIFIEYLRSAQQGMPIAPGSKKNKFHVIYAPDAAEAFYLAFQKRLQGIHRIIIGNSECESMDNIFTLFCKEAGIKKPRLIPKWLIYPTGFLLEAFYTFIHAKNPPLLTRGRINTFYDNIEYETKYAEKILTFKNQYSLSQGIKNTVEWYKHQELNEK